MTREEAMKTIESAKNFAYDVVYEKAFDMAIKALEQEPCEDCISRKGVISQVEYVLSHPDSELRKGLEDTLRKAKTCISIQPKTDVLDKIRAEIIELRSRQNVGVLECLDIIDKYKAESEGKE